MMSEAKARKVCLKEAEAEMARREKEQANAAAAHEVSRRKEVINGKLQELREERDRFIDETIELRKTNPEASKIMIAKGAAIDIAIQQAEKAVVMADSLGIEERISALIDESFSLIRKLNTTPVRFRTKKELAKIERDSKLHSIVRELAEQARQQEWGIYTGEIGSGVGSTFEADVLARERAAAIEDIDD